MYKRNNRGFLQSTFEIYGILKVANLLSNPFHAFCAKCNYKFENYGTLEEQVAFRARCNEEVTYIYSPYLKTILITGSKQTIHCFADKSIVQLLLPNLHNTTYEEYIEDKPAVIFMLHDFSARGHFTLNHNNVIIHANSVQQ